MIEVRSAAEPKTEVTGTKPEKITTSMIINDLDSGIDRAGIQAKYSLETWEVKQMFQHPTLKGRKAKKVRKLSFEFVDDTENAVDPRQTSIPVETTPAENFHNTADLRTADAIEVDSFDDEDDSTIEL